MSSSSTPSNTNHDQTTKHSSTSVKVPRLSDRHTHSSPPRPDGERKRCREATDIPWIGRKCPSVLAGTQRQQQTESTSPTTTQRYPDHHHQMGSSNPDDQIIITMANQKSSECHLRRSAALQEIVRVLKLIALEDQVEVRRESAFVLLQMLSANSNPTNEGYDEVTNLAICESDSVSS